MYNDTITRRDLLETVKAVAREVMEYNPDATDIDELDDAIHEQADGLVNVYTYACMQEWLEAGMPEAEDYIGEPATGTIIEQVMAGMYFWYRDELTNELDDLLNARNEALYENSEEANA